MDKSTIVKLGGSAITDKSKPCTPNLQLIHRAADELANYHGDLILLHGGGSYAHPLALSSSLQKGFVRKSQLNAVSQIELQLDELTRIVGVSLLLRNRPFAPIKAMSCMKLKSGQISKFFLEAFISALKLGLTPLMHGDIAFDENQGFGILSADRIASLLASNLPVSRVLFGSDVDGVYTENPKTSKRAEFVETINRKNYKSVLKRVRKTSAVDASGGMCGKVIEAISLARRGCESHIFNLKRESTLRDLVEGKKLHGTRFAPWEERVSE
ncbi:MAG TPA: isopentenyl phosphate kinase [Candidatus Bathyarchaeia archaeon]|nr:isopentenyl phosphate kinase [Candidatus Bathyarchaeia archaeon]